MSNSPNANLSAAEQSIAAAQSDIDALQAQLSDDQGQLAAAQEQLTAAQATEVAQSAEIANLQAKVSGIKPVIRELLYPGCTAKIVGHTELSVNSKSRPFDRTRWPLYDQQNQTDVIAHCHRLKAQGLDVLMPNCYKMGGSEDAALSLYLNAMGDAGLTLIVNMDKGIWAGATTAGQIQSTIQAYIDNRLRKDCFTKPFYEKWNGKYVVTFFAAGSAPETPAVFASIRAANPDIEFVNNVQGYGGGQMSWMKFGLDTAAYQNYYTGWLKNFSAKKDGHLYIPHFSPGADDSYQGHSIWPNKDGSFSPPRICPAGGPNLDFVKWHFGQINSFYSTSNQPPYVQGVTVNDWDEKTAMEPLADGTGGYFSNA